MSFLTDDDRARIRAKQDRLLDAIDRRFGSTVKEDMHLTNDANAPTVAQLRTLIFPAWESTIERITKEHERDA